VVADKDMPHTEENHGTLLSFDRIGQGNANKNLDAAAKCREPTGADHDLCAHSRIPMDMIFQG
jgi:hypothetical protein